MEIGLEVEVRQFTKGREIRYQEKVCAGCWYRLFYVFVDILLKNSISGFQAHPLDFYLRVLATKCKSFIYYKVSNFILYDASSNERELVLQFTN